MKELWPVGRDGGNRERSFIMREGRDFNISSLFGGLVLYEGLGVKSFRRGRLWCR